MPILTNAVQKGVLLSRCGNQSSFFFQERPVAVVLCQGFRPGPRPSRTAAGLNFKDCAKCGVRRKRDY